MDESSQKLIKSFYFALGCYSEQESKKFDGWRDENLINLFLHLKHELDEIRNNLNKGEVQFLVHNCADAVGLSCMLLARALELQNKEVNEKKVKKNEKI